MLIVENIQDYRFFLDFYVEKNIIISNSSNQSGIINNDESGSFVNHNGTYYILSGTSSGVGNYILYDDLGFVYVDRDFTEDDLEYRFLIKNNKTIKYKINANKISQTITTNEVPVDLSSSSVFKVFLNGKEITDYSLYSDKIILNNVSIDPAGDNCTIYTYNNNQTVNGTITLKYLAPQKQIPDLQDLLNESYFADKYEIKLFDSVSINKNLLYDEQNSDFIINKEGILTDRDNVISITLNEDIRTLIERKKFRLLIWDYKNRRLKNFINTFIKKGVNQTLKRFSNEYNYEFVFEGEYLFEYYENEEYGTYTYGAYVYGGKDELLFII